MGKILKFIENKEDLKIIIRDYTDGNLDIIHCSNIYYTKHWQILKRKKERKEISEIEFKERLHDYLWTPKISELIIILYLEDIKGINPNIYQLNKFLRRNEKHYSATFKAIKKLERLNIIFTKPIAGAPRGSKQIFINKEIVKIYGDDEFRQMMLDEWNTDAKEYTKKRLNYLRKDKEKVENKIKMIKKGKRVKTGVVNDK